MQYKIATICEKICLDNTKYFNLPIVEIWENGVLMQIEIYKQINDINASRIEIKYTKDFSNPCYKGNSYLASINYVEKTTECLRLYIDSSSFSPNIGNVYMG